MEFNRTLGHLVYKCLHVSGKPSCKLYIVCRREHISGGECCASLVIILLQYIDCVSGIVRIFCSNKVDDNAANVGLFYLLMLIVDICHESGKESPPLGRVSHSAVQLVAENGYTILVYVRAVVVHAIDFRLFNYIRVYANTISKREPIVGSIKVVVEVVQFSSDRTKSNLVYCNVLEFLVVCSHCKNSAVENLTERANNRVNAAL